MSTDSTIVDISNSESRLCRNLNCQKILVQREDEPESKFVKRLHCDEHCSRSNRERYEKQSAEYTALRLAQTKVCEICKDNFHRRKGESKKVFEERATCGKICAGVRRRRETDKVAEQDKKICEVCGKEFTRRVRSETRSKFKKRKTCGNGCGVTARMRTLGATERKSSGGMAKVVTKSSSSVGVPALAPISPLPIDIPDPPPPPPEEKKPVWRPNAYGWSKEVKV